MTPSTRKALLNLHVWAGLLVGTVLLLVAISGAVLIFRPHLERRMDAGRFIVTPGATRLSLDDLAARARAAHPGVDLESTRFYGDPTMPVLMYFTDKRYVHLDPYTGAVLGLRARYGEGFGWFEGLHKYLQLAPDPGETITGGSSLVFVGIILTGLVLWWPATRRALAANLTLNRKLRGRPWQLNLHKVLGLYAAVVVLFSAATGGPIAFEWVKDGLYFLTGTQRELPPPAPVNAASPTPFVGFAAIDRQLHQLLPGARETYIALPKEGIVPAYCIAADAPHPNARSYAWFNPADAALLRQIPYAQANAGFRLYFWLLSVHTGMQGGLLVQFILLLGALAVPVLTYTGAASYLRRRAGRTVAQTIPAAAPLPRSVSFHTSTP